MDTTDKKLNLEDLSREDLIKRCKALFSLAQKTKATKQLLQEENIKLKKSRLQEVPNATQELLETLTNEKLLLVTQIEELKAKNSLLENKVKEEYQEKLNTLETENISYQRQIGRLTEENEQLLVDLTTLEAQIGELNKLGEGQREQLLKLEKVNEERLVELQNKLSLSLEEVKALNNNLTVKNNEIKELSCEIQALKIIARGNRNSDTPSKEIEDLKLQNENYSEKLLVIEEVNEKLRDKVACYHSKLKKFALTVKQIKQDKNEILGIFKAYTQQINEWKQQLLIASGNLVRLADNLENNITYRHLSENEGKIFNDSKETVLKEKSATIVDLQQELVLKEKEIDKLSEVINQSMNTERQLAGRSSEEILRLVQSNKELEQRNSLLQEELSKITDKSCASVSIQTDQDCGAFKGADECSIDLKRENSELLLEMNQMNQVLKERGEIISKLEAHCDEVKKKLQLYETQANKNVDCISEKEELIKQLTSEVHALKSVLKDSEVSVDNSCAESETMSTSTISKSEESGRLKDLEGSWEERYGKLRALALKLKAKIKEQSSTIVELHKDNEELHKKWSSALKNVQNLQEQIDKREDELDQANAANKQYLSKLSLVAEDISKNKQLLVQNEEEIFKLTKELAKLRDEKQAVDNWKKQVGAKVQMLRKELETKNQQLKEVEVRVANMEVELDVKDKQLKSEQERHKQTATECKKNSVLNLEMQDYERSAKELSQKLEQSKSEVVNLQTQLEMQKNTVGALREQNKLLEQQKIEAQDKAETSLLEINSCKKKILELEALLALKQEKVLEVTGVLETARCENEELSTELSKVIGVHQKSLDALKLERNQTYSLQQSLREVLDKLEMKEHELMDIKVDYESYKVRAQSVLKKSQSRDVGMEEKLAEEVATVKLQNSKLHVELKDIKDILQKLQSNNEELSKDKDKYVKKCQELENEVEELKTYCDKLSTQHQKIVSEHAETVRNLKVHAETLSQCYRQQLAEQETRHNREIIELQSRLEKVPSPTETTPVHPNMPREEGEGSESIESNSKYQVVHPVPLERLLDFKSDDEIKLLKKNLLEQESKVLHLTALLSDTEQDLAKHVQMNKLLKEEIRRQQRSVEREKHAENLEYLKNVVFKFVTINSGDERSQLVPVLNTILKLSPEETQKLIAVAKGDPGMNRWTSYLPLWPSLNKPQ